MIHNRINALRFSILTAAVVAISLTIVSMSAVDSQAEKTKEADRAPAKFITAEASQSDQTASGKSCSATQTSSGKSCSSGTNASQASTTKAIGIPCGSGGDDICEKTQACTVTSKLASSGPGDDLLKMVETEFASDGKLYEDYSMPEFEAVTAEGVPVNTANLFGEPTLLVMLGAHCGHSLASMPILQRVADEYADRNLRVIGLWVNGAKDKQKITTLAEAYGLDYPVWLYPDASLGDKMESHLVPTYFLLDSKGSVKQKLVGMKQKEEITAKLDSFLATI